MEKTYANTLENMMVDFENSPFENIETKMAEKIGKETGDKKTVFACHGEQREQFGGRRVIGRHSIF